MNFLLELLELLFLRLLLFLFNRGLSLVVSGDALGKGLAFEAGGRVRFHGGAEALGRAWHVGARAHTLVRRGGRLGLEKSDG